MWLIAFLSTFAGIMIGGSIAWLFRGFQQKMNVIYAICAGLILGLISIEMIPETIEISGWFNSFVGIFLGIFLFRGLHSILHYNHTEDLLSKKSSNIQISLLLMLSILIHNLPMGIMFGANVDSELRYPLLQALFFHSIPEGVILFTPLMLVKHNRSLWIIFSFIVSIPVAIGAFIGKFIGQEFFLISAFIMSFTIGLILMVTITEILFVSLKKSHALSIVLYTLAGFGMMALYLKII
ncbi:ZIP family zinc transporter [Ureibacillus xyleni]|uniref:ZIP family zinc transporter n=2 Tax=Ureibacillus xyleni TaxID=614648 RepID=A0A285TT55_9BACL|nr:ZIP family zinc transporter [Ureibacillus xyleni]